MTQEQLDEAIRLRESGSSIAMAAAAVGVTTGTLGGALYRKKIKTKDARRLVSLTHRQLLEAQARHSGGESWREIAVSYGVGRSTLMFHIKQCRDIARSSEPRKIPVKGPVFAGQTQLWQSRKIRRVIKPPSEVNELAKLFVAGKISRSEFVMGIRA